MALRTVDKLIQKAARETLRPMGLFQRGHSRVWLDDNGWFLTVVEFQPSAWSQGAYLNVGASFLWEQGPASAAELPYDYTFGPTSREMGHVPYTGDDETFCLAMLDMTEHAAESARKYRTRLENPGAACQIWEERCARQGWSLWNAWNGGMLRYLCGNVAEGDRWLDTLLEREPWKSGIGWAEELRRLAEEIRSLPDKQAFAVGSIREKRARLRNRASYQKLPMDPVYL